MECRFIVVEWSSFHYIAFDEAAPDGKHSTLSGCLLLHQILYR